MNNEQDYPSVELAYQIAVQSYDWIAKRADALDGKVQTLMAIIATVSLAVPVAFSTLKLIPDPLFLISALVFFTLAIGIGMFCRLHGALIMVSPTVLYDKWIDLPPETFKADMVAFAGNHFDENANLLDRKHTLLKISLFMFALEIVSLAVSVSV